MYLRALRGGLMWALAVAWLASSTATAQYKITDETAGPGHEPLPVRSASFRLADYQPPAEDDPPEREPETSSLPETVVIGRRPPPFPTAPLDPNTALAPGRSAGDVSRFGGSVTVINRAQIEQSRQTNVADVLRGTVGLDVARSGGPGGATSIFLRGGNSAHTKVLLDGVPINDPSNATRLFDFGALSIDNVERIEVLRGPQSMVYGSDALGGVINIVTRRGDGPRRITSTSEGGSFGTWRQALSVSGGDEQSYYSLAGSYSHTDGVSRANRNLGNTERDRFRLGTIGGRVGRALSDTLNVDYVFRYVDADAEIDDFGVDNLIRTNPTNEFFNRVQLQSTALDGLIVQKAGFSLSDYRRRDTDPGFFGVPLFAGQSRQVDYQALLELREDNILVGGVDYYHEEAATDSIAQRSQNNAGVYVEDRFSLGDRSFNTIGVRFDEHSTAGDAQTYRFTSRLEWYEVGASFHGSIGTGFRAPSLAEKLFPGGNALLDPETVKGWDIGVRQQLTPCLWVDATSFRSDYRNLVEFDFNTFLVQNIGRARANGVELTGGWERGCTSLLATYTFNDTLDQAFGGKLPRRPQQKASVTLSRRLLDDQARVNLYLLYVGDRLDFAQRFGGTVLEDYFLLNLSGSARMSESWELFARIDNLLDEDYEEAGGFGSPGIAAYGGVNVYY